MSKKPKKPTPNLENAIVEQIRDIDPELMLMDGYDDCIIGIVERAGAESCICYDKAKILQRHQDDGMTPEEAVEYFEFNQIGAWVGERTPCFIEILTP